MLDTDWAMMSVPNHHKHKNVNAFCCPLLYNRENSKKLRNLLHTLASKAVNVTWCWHMAFLLACGNGKNHTPKCKLMYRGADKSLARLGRKQANVSVRMAWISFSTLPRRKRNLMTAHVSILLKSHVSLTCFQDCFLPGRAKDLSAPRYMLSKIYWP